MRAVVVTIACLTLAPVALAASVDRTKFRYTRSVDADAVGRAIVIEPDERLLAHSLDGFADLRALDATGQAVPWRPRPYADAAPHAAQLLNSGRRDGVAVALVDLGRRRDVRDRLELDIPGRNFVGRVTVLGADRRAGPFTRLAATTVYDVRGAKAARSTMVTFEPTDFRDFELRATGVAGIRGVTAVSARRGPPVVRRRAVVRRSERGTRTILTLDMGYRGVPVDELAVSAATKSYSRPLTVQASNDGRRFRFVTAGMLTRFAGSSSPALAIGSRERYLRVVVENGDDEPLRGLHVRPLGRSRAIVLEGGHPRPYRLLYGAPTAAAPQYEFARLPLAADTPLVRGRLGRERANPAFAQPRPSFGERHGWIANAALATAAVAVGVAAFLVFRRRA